MAAYWTLVNFMLSANSSAKALVDLPTQRPRALSHVHSFLEQQEEFHHDDTKTHFRWPVISSVLAVLDKTLALHQHGPLPKGLPASHEWPPTPVSNPWDENFMPKEAPTSV